MLLEAEEVTEAKWWAERHLSLVYSLFSLNSCICRTCGVICKSKHWEVKNVAVRAASTFSWAMREPELGGLLRGSSSKGINKHPRQFLVLELWKLWKRCKDELVVLVKAINAEIINLCLISRSYLQKGMFYGPISSCGIYDKTKLNSLVKVNAEVKR